MRVRRTALMVAAAGVIAFAPTVAFADSYGASDYTVTSNDTAPSLGESFTITVRGPNGEDVTLTITSNPSSISSSAITISGTKSLTRTIANGAAVFTVSLSQPGSFTAVVTDADGTVISTEVFVVGAAGSGDGGLAETGSDERPVILGAAALVLVGTGGVLVARRRRLRGGH